MEAVNLVTARKLKKAKFPQKTQYFWVQGEEWFLCVKNFPMINFDEAYKDDLNGPTDAWYINGFNDEYAENVEKYIAAPTADEILNLLPHGVMIYKHRTVSLKGKTTFGFRVLYASDFFDNDSLVEGLAEMWLLLKEKHLL